MSSLEIRSAGGRGYPSSATGFKSPGIEIKGSFGSVILVGIWPAAHRMWELSGQPPKHIGGGRDRSRLQSLERKGAPQKLMMRLSSFTERNSHVQQQMAGYHSTGYHI